MSPRTFFFFFFLHKTVTHLNSSFLTSQMERKKKKRRYGFTLALLSIFCILITMRKALRNACGITHTTVWYTNRRLWFIWVFHSLSSLRAAFHFARLQPCNQLCMMYIPYPCLPSATSQRQGNTIFILESGDNLLMDSMFLVTSLRCSQSQQQDLQVLGNNNSLLALKNPPSRKNTVLAS